MRTLLKRDLAARIVFRALGIAILSTAISVSWGAVQIPQLVLRDSYDVFWQFTTSPIALVTPILVSIASAYSFFEERMRRFTFSVIVARGRSDTYLLSKLVSALLLGFTVTGLPVLALFTVAHIIWPLLGNPFIDPSIYGMTTQEAHADAATRVTYSELIHISPWLFAVSYATWVGFGGAVFAAGTVLALCTIQNAYFAFVVPFGLYLGETVAAALVDLPHWGLMSSAYPYGLTPVPALEGAAAMLAVALGLIVAWIARLATASSFGASQ